MNEIERLRFDEELIRNTANWWSKEMQEKGNKLKELLSSESSSLEEIEELRRQIEVLKKKSFSEQELIEKHEEKKNKLLRGYLITGCLQIDLDYKSV